MAKRPSNSAPLPIGTVRTLQELAAAAGVSYTTAKNWRKTPGFPDPDGPYSIWRVAQWNAGRRAAAGKSDEESEDTREALEMDKLRLEISSRELKLRTEAGELVERPAVLAALEKLFHQLRGRLDAIPQELVTSLPPDQQADALADWRRKISLIEREIAAWEPPV